jgi:acyl-CoA thioesterase I
MWTVAFGLLLAALALPAAAQDATSKDRPVKIVALGDSLTAGYGLPASEAFPAKLQRALKAKGIDVEIVNAGVSGDTATGGLERLDWALTPDTDAVIVELGANDMLRGLDHKVTRAALDSIVRKLRERRIAVLVAGMVASPNLGPDYANAFNRIYPEIAQAHGALYYPFFLDGIAALAKFNQPDGLHPTAAGIDVIVSKILPSVEQLIAQVKTARNS